MSNRDITYKDYKKKSDIHGTVLYPAVMVAPMQKDVLADLIDTNVMTKIIDPFHGSGTSLYEATEITENVQLFGCDINPLANLITRVKLQGVNNNIENDIKFIMDEVLKTDTIVEHSFYNINKWFRKDIIMELSKIRYAIIKIKSKQNRLFFWYILVDFVRKYSNTRSSTYKLHVKKSEKIICMKNNLISEYFDAVELNYRKFCKHFKSFSLVKGDTLEYIKSLANEEIDICITSPPYGDNATTVPYGQFSMLAIFWIDSKDLELEGWELENYSAIDSKSFGGCKQELENINCSEEKIKSYLSKISKPKQKKVIRFFNAYFKFLEEICRITKKNIVLTLGNRTVDGVNIDLTSISINYLTDRGFTLEENIEREIISKRIPKKTSKVRNKSVSSMNSEYLVVMSKSN